MGRSDWKRLGWALAIAVGLHVLLFLALVFLAGVAIVMLGVQQAKTNPISEKAKDREPIMFIDVSEAQSIAEPPKDAIRYSDRNAIAANPDANKESNEPKIEGEKNELQKIDDEGRRNKFNQLMPDPPKPEPEAQAEPKRAPGTMTVAKAELKPPQERKRPRTMKDVALRNNPTPGKRSQQDGGASRRGDVSFDVKMTGFGTYDRALIDAVRHHWYNLLDSLSADNYQQGKVVVQFDLDYKGRATNVKVVESNVSESLAIWCVKAISDPSPYGEWTREMRLAVGEDSRNVKFTFFYY